MQTMVQHSLAVNDDFHDTNVKVYAKRHAKKDICQPILLSIINDPEVII